MTLAIERGRIGCLIGGAVLALALSACDTMQPQVARQTGRVPLDAMLAQASQAGAAGQKEQAVTLWRQAAAAYPADKAPWSNIAQTRYDAGQYGEAIVSAQEVLVRDPNDRLANSIIAISGLRLSTRALADLSRQNNLSGSIRTESQDLAKLLRESLGEQVLVPPAAPARTNVAKGKKPVKAKDEDGSSANPFNILNK